MSQNRQILDDIAGRVQEIINAETAVVALAESEGEIVHYAAAAGKHVDWILDRRGASATSGLCGKAFQGYQPVLVCRATGRYATDSYLLDISKNPGSQQLAIEFACKFCDQWPSIVYDLCKNVYSAQELLNFCRNGQGQCLVKEMQ